MKQIFHIPFNFLAQHHPSYSYSSNNSSIGLSVPIIFQLPSPFCDLNYSLCNVPSICWSGLFSLFTVDWSRTPSRLFRQEHSHLTNGCGECECVSMWAHIHTQSHKNTRIPHASNFLLLFRDLSNNQITELASDSFQGLRSLNSLWVYMNIYLCVCVCAWEENVGVILSFHHSFNYWWSDSFKLLEDRADKSLQCLSQHNHHSNIQDTCHFNR